MLNSKGAFQKFILARAITFGEHKTFHELPLREPVITVYN